MPPPPLTTEIIKADFSRIRRITVDGITFSIPRTKEGKYLLWRCLPRCGKCCFPRILALLPRDVENLAQHHGENIVEFLTSKTQVSRFTKLKNYAAPILTHPRDGERCQYLNKSLKCSVYGQRPHPCRIYPFNYDGEGNVGYIEKAVREECPGFYLADAPDPRFLGILKGMAAEIAEGFREMEITPKAKEPPPIPVP